LNLSELKALCEASTPGPWQTRFIYRMFVACREAPDTLMGDKSKDWGDAAFIAAARTYMPLLVAVAEAADVFALCLQTGNTKQLCGECPGCRLIDRFSALSSHGGSNDT
jgi:hypothetical protein